jgi:hypothetical protein
VGTHLPLAKKFELLTSYQNTIVLTAMAVNKTM